MRARCLYSLKLSSLVAMIVLLGVIFGSSNVVGAEATTAAVQINAGTLHFEGSPGNVDFGTINLTQFIDTNKGADNNFFKDLTDFTVVDSRGSGAGWTVQVTAEKLEATGSILLVEGSLSLNKPASITQDYTGTANTFPIIVPTDYVAIDGTTPINIITAAANSGLGRWTINWGTTPNNALKLHLDAGTIKAGVYNSTITWELVAPVGL